MDHADRLGWMIEEIRERTVQLTIRVIAASEEPLLAVTASWLKACVDAGAGVLALVLDKKAGAAVPLERTAWEIWQEFHYLAQRGTRVRDAVKVQAFALIEVLRALEKSTDPPDGMRERMKAALDRLEAVYPQEVSELRGQKDRRHWSGNSRTSVVTESEADKLVYKILSWDSHGVIASIRDVEVNRNANETTVRFVDDDEASSMSDRAAWAVGGYLFYMYNEFAEIWGLRPLDLLDSAA